MDARAIIAALRQGKTPSDAEMRWFAEGLANGQVSDAQAGAFAMAVCLQGLDVEARRALTLAMRDSGDVLQWDLDGPVLDKHSTGGVGDCVSLLLAPALAECGAYVPMISGRGLGHTGGTLDKMEAIPGVSTQVSQDALQSMMRDVGCAIVGATAQIAPADKRLYAIRDVTATVESLDLITASILSKKLAAGTDALVLDVKLGSGAFMKTRAEAEALARSLSETANAAGCRTSALITDMNQPLAPALGNALEVAEVMRILTGQGGARQRPGAIDRSPRWCPACPWWPCLGSRRRGRENSRSNCQRCGGGQVCAHGGRDGRTCGFCDHMAERSARGPGQAPCSGRNGGLCFRNRR